MHHDLGRCQNRNPLVLIMTRRLETRLPAEVVGRADVEREAYVWGSSRTMLMALSPWLKTNTPTANLPTAVGLVLLMVAAARDSMLSNEQRKGLTIIMGWCLGRGITMSVRRKSLFFLKPGRW